MNAKEFYRERLIETSSEGIMKRIAKAVNIDQQSKICEEYHQYKLAESNSEFFTKLQALSMLVDVTMESMGDEWIPNEDDNFKRFLSKYNLLELFNSEY